MDILREGQQRWTSDEALAMAPEPPTPAMAEEATASLSTLARQAGIGRVDVVAWRDLDDPEAGGSELHAHEVLRRWAAAGIDVTSWTSRVDGAARSIERDGYRVQRRGGRYAVFPRTALAGLRRQLGAGDALVEIWNGMPFFSPLWNRGPRLVILHHVHAEMWEMVLSPRLARLGSSVESRLAPPWYRHSRILTLSTSARDDIVERLGLRAEQVTVAPPGIDPKFSPGGRRSPEPLVVAVGRLVPVKRFDRFIEVMTALRAHHPRLRAVVVGEGYERPALEAQIAASGAGDWLVLAGRVSDDELVDLYRQAWMVMSTSVKEGWGMTLSEAAACGTPAVATRIPGHLDAVAHGETGLLADSDDELLDACEALLGDPMLRRRLGQGALRQAEQLTWDRTARTALEALAEQVRRRR